jgi:tetratricopeptide (TPR) repeat protein
MSSVAITRPRLTLFSKDGKTLHVGKPLKWRALSREDGDVVKIVVGQLAKEGDSTIQLFDPFPEDLTELFPSLTHLHLWNIDGLERLPVLPAGLKCLDVRGCRSLVSLLELPSGLDTLVIERCPALVLDAIADRTQFANLEDLSLKECPAIGETWICAVLAGAPALRKLDALGVLDCKQNRIEEARNELDEALKTFRDVAQKNPEIYLPDVAETLNDLGKVERDQNRMEEARTAYVEALTIRREFAQKNPETYLLDVGETLNGLGELYRDQNRPDEARRAFDEALTIRRQLAQKNPEAYLPGVAETLNNIGVFYRKQNRPTEARKAYGEALQIRREFAQKNLEAYLPDVGETLNNMGELDRERKRMKEARKELDEALRIYELFARCHQGEESTDEVTEMSCSAARAVPGKPQISADHGSGLSVLGPCAH